ncbi:Hypothetical predicted protein, partial [Cloeon dipterum]
QPASQPAGEQRKEALRFIPRRAILSECGLFKIVFFEQQFEIATITRPRGKN